MPKQIRLSRRRKNILERVIASHYAFDTLWDTENCDGKDFKELYGCTEGEAREALEALVFFLRKL